MHLGGMAANPEDYAISSDEFIIFTIGASWLTGFL